VEKRKIEAEAEKLRAETAATIGAAYAGLVDDLQEQLKDLRARADASEKRIGDLEAALGKEQKRVADLSRKLAQAVKRIAELEQENACLREKNEHLTHLVEGRKGDEHS
jgi:chromosome segregation ATPase